MLEIADVFVVNKADRPGADRTVTELRDKLTLAPPVRDQRRLALPDVPSAPSRAPAWRRSPKRSGPTARRSTPAAQWPRAAPDSTSAGFWSPARTSGGQPVQAEERKPRRAAGGRSRHARNRSAHGSEAAARGNPEGERRMSESGHRDRKTPCSEANRCCSAISITRRRSRRRRTARRRRRSSAAPSPARASCCATTRRCAPTATGCASAPTPISASARPCTSRTATLPAIIGDDVTVGHFALVHACTRRQPRRGRRHGGRHGRRARRGGRGDHRRKPRAAAQAPRGRLDLRRQPGYPRSRGRHRASWPRPRTRSATACNSALVTSGDVPAPDTGEHTPAAGERAIASAPCRYPSPRVGLRHTSRRPGARRRRRRSQTTRASTSVAPIIAGDGTDRRSASAPTCRTTRCSSPMRPAARSSSAPTSPSATTCAWARR